MNWFPLHDHCSMSLSDGLSTAVQIAERVQELGYTGAALTDHASIAGCPAFAAELKKKNLKPILGNEVNVCYQDASIRDKSNQSYSHLLVLAKNQDGWRNLIKATSASNKPEHFYRRARLDLDKWASFSNDNWITFSGHLGSELANCVFGEPKLAYRAKTYEEAKALVSPDWEKNVVNTIRRHQDRFGKENFYVEIQMIDKDNLPASEIVGKILRHVAKKEKVKTIATADSHYCTPEQAADQRILLCSLLQTTLSAIQRKLDNAEEVGLEAFFRSSKYGIPTIAEMQALHTEEELANTLEIAARCSDYELKNQPFLPVFDCPNGQHPDAYLRHLCELGLKRVGKQESGSYKDRLNHELNVITGAGLSSYFLIVEDFIKYITNVVKGIVGKGRGSAAGCLVSYLTGITRVDPLKYDLIFERFYNSGRNTPGNVEFPDIDTDVQTCDRDKVISYLKQKYGDDRVCQMATFSRNKGRGVLKDVLRAHERCSFEEMNEMSKWIPDPASISDDLQLTEEEYGESSIIWWALENNAKELEQWCSIDKDGNLQGPLAKDYEQAIRLEMIHKGQGKHASGVIVSSETVGNIAPMLYDKSSGQQICGFDMDTAKMVGLVKIDILGLRTLDCLNAASKLIRGEYEFI